MAQGALLPALPLLWALGLPVPPWGRKVTSCVSHAESHPVPGTFVKPTSGNTTNPALRSLTPPPAKSLPSSFSAAPHPDRKQGELSTVRCPGPLARHGHRDKEGTAAGTQRDTAR